MIMHFDIGYHIARLYILNNLLILRKNLGFSAFIDDQNKINKIVETIMERFDLIMISDYMDESRVSI